MTNYPSSEPSYDQGATPPGYPDHSAATAYPVPEAPGAPTKQKKPRRWVAMVLVGVLAFIIGVVAGSAGDDDGSDSTTAAGAGLSDDAEVAELESDREELQGELESVTAELETVTAERDDLSGDLEAMTEERDTALASAEEAEAEIREADAEAEAAAEEEEAQAADTGFGDGSWRIGEDIEPGTYRSDGGGSCYWERLSGFSGELDDIIANDFSSGPTTVTIAESDAGFTSQRCGTWELQE